MIKMREDEPFKKINNCFMRMNSAKSLSIVVHHLARKSISYTATSERTIMFDYRVGGYSLLEYAIKRKVERNQLISGAFTRMWYNSNVLDVEVEQSARNCALCE